MSWKDVPSTQWSNWWLAFFFFPGTVADLAIGVSLFCWYSMMAGAPPHSPFRIFRCIPKNWTKMGSRMDDRNRSFEEGATEIILHKKFPVAVWFGLCLRISWNRQNAPMRKLIKQKWCPRLFFGLMVPIIHTWAHYYGNTENAKKGK